MTPAFPIRKKIPHKMEDMLPFTSLYNIDIKVQYASFTSHYISRKTVLMETVSPFTGVITIYQLSCLLFKLREGPRVSWDVLRVSKVKN